MNLKEYYKVKLLEKLNLHEKQEKPWLDSLNLDTMTSDQIENELRTKMQNLINDRDAYINRLKDKMSQSPKA